MDRIKHWVAQPIVLSLALHALLVALIGIEFSREISQAIRNPAGIGSQSLQVRSLTEKDLQKELANALDKADERKTIVHADDNLKSEKAPDESGSEKVYLSKHNQVVDHNTRAPRVGAFKNVLKEGVKGDQNTSKTAAEVKTESSSDPAKASAAKLTNLMTLTPEIQDTEQSNRLTQKTGRLRVAKNTETKPSRAPASIDGPAGDGVSATDDYLDDIAVGANTLLNTKEFVFYSFYERIREKLSHAWHSRLEPELNQIYSKGENLGFDRKTKVEVDLDSQGQLKSVRLVGTSGFDELDRAAVDAFKMAAPFPNPPAAMIEGDKKIVAIHWDFVVMADAAGTGIRMQVRRAPAGF